MDSSYLSSLRWIFEWVGGNLPLAVAMMLAAPAVLSLLVLALKRLGSAPAIGEPEIAAPPAEVEPAVEEAPVVAEPGVSAAPEAVAEPEAVPEPIAEPVTQLEPTQEPLPGLEPPPPPPPEPVAEPEPVAPEPEPTPVTISVGEPELVSEVAPPRRVSLRERLSRTSETLVGRLGGLLSGRKVDADLLEELEMMLFTADLGAPTAEALLESVRSKASGADAEVVRDVLHAEILERLKRVEPEGEPLATRGKPHVILVLGVNGSGKTTTIGKLAARYAETGKKVILGAGDTFRAAAIEQLQVWGDRVGCEVVAGQPGGDPAAVAFDTVKAAIARGADVAIVDTAGRLQTKKPLMEELGKIVRVLGRDLEDAPHETLLVLDSNTGQNAISQARLFSEVANVTGLVLTKLDGSAKGGVIVGLADEFGIPMRFVGVGEGIEDLRDFEASEFVDALFESDG